MEDVAYKSHWNNKYQSTQDESLGWYEDNPEVTMRLVSKCNLSKNASILNVGAGTTMLIDSLLEEGYTNVIANDLSDIALEKLQQRILEKFSHNLNIIEDDLTQSLKLNELQNVDLWIDRAVLHFFLNEESQNNYFNLIKQIVAKGGYVLIAVFALDGASKCCELDLKRYNTKMLHDKLGERFQLVESFNYTYINPLGDDRPYIYTLFKKQ